MQITIILAAITRHLVKKALSFITCCIFYCYSTFSEKTFFLAPLVNLIMRLAIDFSPSENPPPSSVSVRYLFFETVGGELVFKGSMVVSSSSSVSLMRIGDSC